MLKKSIVVICLCLLPLSVQAKGKSIDGSAAEILVEIMEMHDSDIDLVTDTAGDPMINAMNSGYDYHVFFYDCTPNEDCTNLMFHALFYDTAEQISSEDIMAFNRRNRWVKAYHDTTNGTVLEMDVNFYGQVSPDLLETSYEYWRGAFAKFSALLPY